MGYWASCCVKSGSHEGPGYIGVFVLVVETHSDVAVQLERASSSGAG